MNFFGGPCRKIKLSKNFCIVHDAVVLDKGIASTNFGKKSPDRGSSGRQTVNAISAFYLK